MAVIKNTWIEKQKKKKEHHTAPAYKNDPIAESEVTNAKRPAKRFTTSARATMTRTLRGIRK